MSKSNRPKQLTSPSISNKPSKKSNALSTNAAIECKDVAIPHLSFRFMGSKHPCGFFETQKKCGKKNSYEFYQLLEKFIEDFYSGNYSDVSQIIAAFTSKKGSKISKNNPTVAKIRKYFNNNYKSVKLFYKGDHPNDDLLPDELLHIHLKHDGKGQAVMFGLEYDNTFYVLGFDPMHNFD